MCELVSPTANLSLAGARAFERYHVEVVHLTAALAESVDGRPADALAPPGAADGGQSARQAPPRTASPL